MLGQGKAWCPLPWLRPFPGTAHGHGASPACRLQQKEADEPRHWEHTDFRMGLGEMLCELGVNLMKHGVMHRVWLHSVCQPPALPQLPRSGLMLSWDLLSVAGQLKLHGAASSRTFLCCYCLAKAEALFWSKKNLKSLDGFFSCWGRWECWDRQ